MKNHEELEQIAFVDYLRKTSFPYVFWHTPNGGLRNKITAYRLKKMGVLAGVPDMFFPIPRNGKHGLFIEFKYGKNKLTQNQKNCMDVLIESGYQVEIAYSCEQAIQVLNNYLV